MLSSDCDISHSEYIALLTGLGPDTSLGRIVSIRAETDPEIIKKFSRSEQQIYREWKAYRNAQLREINREKERSQSNKELCEFLRAIFG